MKVKYIEKRSKYLIVCNVGVLICFWIFFYKYILIVYKKDIYFSFFFKRNVVRRMEYCFVFIYFFFIFLIGILFVFYFRDIWFCGGKYFWGGEKWCLENGVIFCDDDYDFGIMIYFFLMFYKLFLNILFLIIFIIIFCNVLFFINYFCFYFVFCSFILRVKRLFFRCLFCKDKFFCYYVLCCLFLSGGLCFFFVFWS